MELWNSHKGLLFDNFSRLVHEAKAQQQEEEGPGGRNGQQRSEEVQPVAQGHEGADNNDNSLSDDGEGEGGAQERAGSASVASRAPPTTTNAPLPDLKPLTAIIASIKSELGLHPATSILDTISQSSSLLGLALVDPMTLKDKAVRVARELNIPVTQGS